MNNITSFFIFNSQDIIFYNNAGDLFEHTLIPQMNIKLFPAGASAVQSTEIYETNNRWQENYRSIYVMPDKEFYHDIKEAEMVIALGRNDGLHHSSAFFRLSPFPCHLFLIIYYPIPDARGYLCRGLSGGHAVHDYLGQNPGSDPFLSQCKGRVFPP